MLIWLQEFGDGIDSTLEAVEECEGGGLVCAVSGLRHFKTWLFKSTPPFTPLVGGPIALIESTSTSA
jgi:hypothetical protein